MVWFVRDITGILCALFTYICLSFGVYGTWKFSIQYYPSNIIYYIHTSFFFFGSILALYSHVKCVFTNPGLLNKLVPKEITKIIRSTHFVEPETRHTGKIQEGIFTIPDIDDIRLCGRCLSIRSTYTHHCRECDGCVFRMDHHCPWINNCVGALNQKFFIQFCSYISFCSFYSLIVTTLRFMSLFYIPVLTTNNVKIHDPSFFIQLTYFIRIYGIWEILTGWFLFLESLCFGGFTLFLLIDQLHNIWNSEGKIDRWKRQRKEKMKNPDPLQPIQKTLSELEICSKMKDKDNINDNNQKQSQKQTEHCVHETELCNADANNINNTDGFLFKISDMVFGESFSLYHWIFPTHLPSSFFKNFSEYKKNLKSQMVLLSRQLTEDQKTRFLEKMLNSSYSHLHTE